METRIKVKSMLYTFLLIILSSFICFGAGPRYKHKEAEKQLEFINVYKDIKAIGISTSGNSRCIDNPTFCVDVINHQVGISTSTPDAPLHVGTVNDDIGVNANILSAKEYSGNSNGHSFCDISTFAGESGTSVASYDSRMKTIGAKDYGHIIGYQSGIIHDSDGTIDHLYDFGAYAFNNGGTATNRYGFYVGNSQGTGVILNQYGLYVENLTKGSTLNYAIYTTGTSPSVFGGQLQGTNGTSGVKLKGTTTDDDATAGEYGEYKESLVSTAQNAGATGVIFDATSVVLSSGDWDVSGAIIYRRNSATFTSTDLEVAISTVSGNSSIGFVNGSNYFYDIGVSSINFNSHTVYVPVYRMKLGSQKTIYLKGLIDVYTAGTPQYYCRLSARRMR